MPYFPKEQILDALESPDLTPEKLVRFLDGTETDQGVIEDLESSLNKVALVLASLLIKLMSDYKLTRLSVASILDDAQ